MVSSPPSSNNKLPDPSTYIAYWPQRRLQDAIYGCVLACVVLIRYTGEAADDAARAAGYEPGHPLAPIVWEITDKHVAIKQVEWRRVHAMRGRLLEDPIKEIAALQLIGGDHPNVLGSSEVLQDNECLYSVMPFCRGGDLFGIVLAAAEERQANEELEGAGGMNEAVARYWFRQLLFGLHYLQEKGICHRDLSLENILVDVNHCLVIDMGMCLRVPYYCPAEPGRSVDVTKGSLRRLITPMGTCGKKNYM
jgi:serine/threonine protein kinase